MKPSPTNEDRFKAAECALKAHSEQKDDNLAYDMLDETIIDLLTDLQHWCYMSSVDFDHALRLSIIHFEAEKDQP